MGFNPLPAGTGEQTQSLEEGEMKRNLNTSTGVGIRHTSRPAIFAAIACCAMLPAISLGQISMQIIGPVFASDVSADGSVVVGNTQGDYETFRWTSGTGVVPLGRATVPVLSVGAGTPSVSADGNRVSATILDDTGTLATQGVWTNGSGWQQLGPYPPDMGPVDQSSGSAWAISGDGNTVTGLYWRDGQSGGLAHASRWTQATGIVDLGSNGGSSRSSGVNYDGTVAVGFEDHPILGQRRPTVWENGVLTVLGNPDDPGEAINCTPNGDIIVGQGWDTVNFYSTAAIWTRNGSNWDQQLLGVLPGTDPIFGGMSIASDISGDGSMVVGLNRLDFFGGDTGIIWTAESGLMSAADWLAARNFVVDPNFFITQLSAISQDGSTIVGIGVDLKTFEFQSFIITLPEPTTFALTALGLLAIRRRGRIAR